MKISVPYGKTVMTAEVPEGNLLGVYESSLPPPAPDPVRDIRQAMDNPIGSPRLEELALGKKNAVVITSDHTRPVPSHLMMPEILRALRAGNPAIDVTILVATGAHRATTQAELAAKLGPEIAGREKIVVHDALDDRAMADLGTLPSGGALRVNRLAVEAELLVGEGFIEPHFFAGFSGGRKSILPGLASRETICANHCAEFIRSPYARTGVLENNPIHRDMLFAAEKAGLDFILNVVIDPAKRIVKSFAGDPRAAHGAGCGFLRSSCGITVPEADIVITSNGGYPLDQNIYQCVKGMTAGEAVCRKGGVIILSASCVDGHGGKSFYEHLASQTPEEILASVAAVSRNATVPDQWQFQILARIMASYTVILVTKDCDHRMIRRMHLTPAATLQEALDQALKITGPRARVSVIPDGVSVIPQRS